MHVAIIACTRHSGVLTHNKSAKCVLTGLINLISMYFVLSFFSTLGSPVGPAALRVALLSREPRPGGEVLPLSSAAGDFVGSRGGSNSGRGGSSGSAGFDVGTGGVRVDPSAAPGPLDRSHRPPHPAPDHWNDFAARNRPCRSKVRPVS